MPARFPGSPVAGARAFHRLPMPLQTSYPRLAIRGMNVDRFAYPQAAAPERARHHRAKAFQREASVDRQARQAQRIAPRRTLCQRSQMLFQFRQTCARD